ncbi:MAG: hypothetical protein IJ087_20970, partial [Eggerthellaceae bacterium]|nr:hypothetical protein [Eggerthellaceae bacterium]
MKKILQLLAMATAVVLLIFPSAAFANTSFLVGDWTTSSGDATFTFRDDGTCISDFGFFPEEGTWLAQETGSAAFPIQIDGSSVLRLMQLAYGGVDAGYHFEVLKCNDDNFYLVQVYGDYTAWSSNCKLPLTRVGAKADFTLPPEEAQQAPADEKRSELDGATANDVRKVSVKFDDANTVNVNWGWNLFNKDSSEYDHNIAMAGVVLSQAAESGEAEAEQRMKDFGFENIASVYYKGNDDNMEMPASTFASQVVNFGGGNKVIAAIVVRGTGDFGDKLTDVRSQLDGFYPSANNVKSRFLSFYGDLSARYGFNVNSENTILFITGHSLGAAVASQLAQMLEGTCGSRNAIFDYNYATPNHETFNYDRGGFTNVHSIVNVHDAVPNVPIGYKKYGNVWYYDSSQSRYRSYFEEIYGETGWHPRNIGDEHVLQTYLSMMLCDLPDNMGPGAVNPYSLTSIHCPVDIEVYDSSGTLMGSIRGQSASLTDASTVIVMVDGDEKYVVAAPGKSYEVKIVGTGAGEMTVVQQSIDPYSGEAVSEKSFDNVPVDPGREFSLSIDGAARASDAVLEGADNAAVSDSKEDGVH